MGHFHRFPGHLCFLSCESPVSTFCPFFCVVYFHILTWKNSLHIPDTTSVSVIGDVFIFFMLFYGISCRTGVLNFNVVKLTSFIFFIIALPFCVLFNDPSPTQSPKVAP